MGKIYQAVPCDQFIKSLKLKEKRKDRASLFCGIFLGPEKLADFKVISRIRTELGNKLDLREVQAVLAKSWKPHLEQTNIVLGDASCYERYMRYPTNVKLTTKRTWSLLYLLEKLIYEQKKIEDQYRIYLKFPEKYYHRRRVIGKVLAQQKEMFTTGTHRVRSQSQHDPGGRDQFH